MNESLLKALAELASIAENLQQNRAQPIPEGTTSDEATPTGIVINERPENYGAAPNSLGLDDPHQAYYQKWNINPHNFLLVQVVDKDNRPRWFAANRSEICGEGGFGKVIKCYPIDTKTGSIQLESPYVAKFLKDPKKSNPEKMKQEVETLGRYYPTFPLAQHGQNGVIVTQYLPGKELSNPTVLAQIAQLNFAERAKLAQSIMMNFNLIHHNTPSTGEALSHADVKPENTLIHIQKRKDGRFDPDSSVIDFGLSEKMDNEDHQKKSKWIKGTDLYMPFETKQYGQYSTRSDIFSIAGMMMIIFGAQNIHAKRKITGEPFNDTGIFNFATIPANMEKLVRGFIGQMNSIKVADRPHTDTCLRFFTDLTKLAYALEIGEINFEDVEKKISDPSSKSSIDTDHFIVTLAKMMLVEANLAQDMMVNNQPIKLDECDIEPSTAIKIINCHRNDVLDPSMMSLIINRSQNLREIADEKADMQEFKKYYQAELNAKRSFIQTIFAKDNKENQPLNFDSMAKVKDYSIAHPNSAVAKAYDRVSLSKEASAKSKLDYRSK